MNTMFILAASCINVCYTVEHLKSSSHKVNISLEYLGTSKHWTNGFIPGKLHRTSKTVKCLHQTFQACIKVYKPTVPFPQAGKSQVKIHHHFLTPHYVCG